MSITYSGGLYFDTVAEPIVFIESGGNGQLSVGATLKSLAKLNSNSYGQLTAGATLKSTAKLFSDVQLIGVMTSDLDVLYSTIKTSKFSDYTILQPLVDHTDLADTNLIMQFRECPNILKLLRVWLTQLDLLTQDIQAFQNYILNLEESTGYLLDNIGVVLGRPRVLGTPDLLYRDELFTQVLVNNSDGTLPYVLTALLSNYRYPKDERSYYDLNIQTRSHNWADVYIKDYTIINRYGGIDVIDKLVPSGARANVIVNRPENDDGDYFSLAGGDGVGLGHTDDPNMGGRLVGTYNRDANSQVMPPFGVETATDAEGLNVGYLLSHTVTASTSQPTVIEGQPTPTTTSPIAVPTFN